MIHYKKLDGVSPAALRLLDKLGADFPLKSLLLDIENFKLTINEVYYDEKLYGVLVLRGERNRRGEMVLVVVHAIAEEKIEIHFSNILAESLQSHAKAAGFEKIRIHTDKAGLTRIAARFLPEPTEYVFTFGVNTCHPATAIQLQHSKQLPAHQISA